MRSVSLVDLRSFEELDRTQPGPGQWTHLLHFTVHSAVSLASWNNTEQWPSLANINIALRGIIYHNNPHNLSTLQTNVGQ